MGTDGANSRVVIPPEGAPSMTIILPILFFAACLGLFARRVTTAHWWVMAVFILLILAYHFFKH